MREIIDLKLEEQKACRRLKTVAEKKKIKELSYGTIKKINLLLYLI